MIDWFTKEIVSILLMTGLSHMLLLLGGFFKAIDLNERHKKMLEKLDKDGKLIMNGSSQWLEYAVGKNSLSFDGDEVRLKKKMQISFKESRNVKHKWRAI